MSASDNCSSDGRPSAQPASPADAPMPPVSEHPDAGVLERLRSALGPAAAEVALMSVSSLDPRIPAQLRPDNGGADSGKRVLAILCEKGIGVIVTTRRHSPTPAHNLRTDWADR